MLVPVLKVENGSRGSILEKPMLPRAVSLPLNELSSTFSKVPMAGCMHLVLHDNEESACDSLQGTSR